LIVGIVLLLCFFVPVISGLGDGGAGAAVDAEDVNVVSEMSIEKVSEKLYIETVVMPGDTLWGIAGRYATPRTDIRKFVCEIMEFNGLENENLRPYQVLRIPI